MPFDAQFRSFQQIVLPEAARRGMAVLGMKPFNGRGDPFHRGEVNLTPQQALRYAMSVPGVTVTITGMESLAVLRQNLAIAKSFTPMTAAEMQAVVAAVAPFAGNGRAMIRTKRRLPSTMSSRVKCTICRLAEPRHDPGDVRRSAPRP
jgi:uncharacterized protein